MMTTIHWYYYFGRRRRTWEMEGGPAAGVLTWVLVISSFCCITEPVKAGCYPQSCGASIRNIPYPFSINPGCGLPDFQLNCSKDTSIEEQFSANPALLLNTSAGVLQIVTFNSSRSSFVVNATSYNAVSCYPNDTAKQHGSFELPVGAPYVLSGNNSFFVRGCDISGNVTSNADCHVDGCDSVVRAQPYCGKKSCCVLAISEGTRNVSFSVRVGSNRSCGYAGIIFPDSYGSIEGRKEGVHSNAGDDASDYGLELIWAIPLQSGDVSADANSVCSVAQNLENYACVPKNSSCIASVHAETQVLGYNCKCKEGFEGDGYVNGTGCEDINECSMSVNKCGHNKDCINEIGNYTCRCKNGYHENGNDECVESRHVIGATVAPTSFILSIILSVIVWRMKKRSKEHQRQIEMDQNEINNLKAIGREYVGRKFSMAQLEKASNGFACEQELGVGGSGKVYKGYIMVENKEDTNLDGIEAAIKMPKNIVGPITDEDRHQFLNEVGILSQFNHENVVKLLGCCLQTQVPLLVYEYISEGSLYDHLHGRRMHEEKLSKFDKRLEIATEVAEGLKYIHHNASPPFIHRDVKSANILLAGETLLAKLADFGISRLSTYNETTNVKGTYGYIDPQCMEDVVNVIDKKFDVYSFGIVLLELITSKKPIINQVNMPIVFWIPAICEGKLHEIVDSRFLDDRNLGSVSDLICQVAKLAIRCLDARREKRPSMIEVVTELQRVAAISESKTIEDSLDNHKFKLENDQISLRSDWRMKWTKPIGKDDDDSANWDLTREATKISYVDDTSVEFDTTSMLPRDTPDSTSEYFKLV